MTAKAKAAPLTADYHDTVRDRARRDPAFRRALLREAIDALLAGKLPVAKIHLRDLVNASVGYDAIAVATGIPNKSVIRMLGPKGNPKADNLLAVIAHLQRAEGVRIETRLRRAS